MSHPLYDDDDAQRPRAPHPLSDAPDALPEGVPAPPKPKPALIVQHTKNPILTYVLIGVNIAIYLYANVLMTDSFGMISAEAVVTYSVFPPYIFERMELHRLFTGMFFHGSLLHIVFNMYALYIIGTSVERSFGTWRFALIYFLGGLGGSVASAVLGDYYVPSIGASGAVFAIWASEAMHVYRHRQMYGGLARSILINTGFFLLMNLFLGISNPQIDNWGHIGGFIGGGILAYFMGPRYQLERRLNLEGRIHVRVQDANPLDRNYLVLGVYVVVLLVVLNVAPPFITPVT